MGRQDKRCMSCENPSPMSVVIKKNFVHFLNSTGELRCGYSLKKPRPIHYKADFEAIKKAKERIKELAEFAKGNLERTSYIRRVTVIVGDGSKGYKPAAPYDKIIVTAAAPSIPEPLIEQLKVGGRMVIPVGDRYTQRLVIAVKTSRNNLEVRHGVPCVFVPLIGEYGFSETEPE